jgi:hypothetical protein
MNIAVRTRESRERAANEGEVELIAPGENHPVAYTIEPDDPIEIDPRPCELCGLTIDRHEMVDRGEGPEFFCADLSPDEMTLPELERRAELRRQEEVAAILARWEAMDEALDRATHPAPVPAAPEPYRPAASTVAAFRFLTAAGDIGRIREWLAERPKDAPHLLAQLEGQDHA